LIAASSEETAMDTAVRRVDTLLDNYSADHQNPTNQAIHLACVPAIAWSVSAMLWAIPSPPGLSTTAWLPHGVWAGLAMVLALIAYWRLSKRLAMGMLVAFVATVFLNRWIAQTYGVMVLLWLGVGAFVVAWVVQFIGHNIEGKRPSFLTDMVYLLVGPIWTLRKLYTRMGWST
jgi:uncharacterized membrane protein YGL010W